MTQEITDLDITLYSTGELSSIDRERVERAAVNDPKIKSKLNDIKYIRRVFKQDAKRNFAVSDETFKGLQRELNIAHLIL